MNIIIKILYIERFSLSVIDGRWKIAIVYHLLQNERLRLSELQNKLPDINQRMLIRQLRELEQDKILERTVYPVVPLKWIID